MQRINPPRYLHKPIATMDDLAKRLGVSKNELSYLIDNGENYIYPNAPETKASGGIRQTYRIGKRLRKLQDKIKFRIFRHVEWPLYLHGAIKDEKAPRDHITDAKAHSYGAHTINLDVSRFFPSISSEQVYLMWLSGFKFSPEVAKALMKLTTRDDWLYEGAPTSPLIANMIFGEHEANLVQEYIHQGITYTRFVDDITISSRGRIEDQKLGAIIGQVYGMLLNKGLQPNRKKQKVYIGEGRGNVHAIITRRGRLLYEKSRRKRIKLEAYNLLKSAEEIGRDSDDYRSRYNSTLGKLSMMRRLHPQEAQREIDKLLEMAPLKRT